MSAADGSEAEALAQADVVVAASLGVRRRPELLLRALGAGVVPVVARLGLYEELLDEGGPAWCSSRATC